MRYVIFFDAPDGDQLMIAQFRDYDIAVAVIEKVYHSYYRYYIAPIHES
jgi:hypothetical protein